MDEDVVLFLVDEPCEAERLRAAWRVVYARLAALDDGEFWARSLDFAVIVYKDTEFIEALRTLNGDGP